MTPDLAVEPGAEMTSTASQARMCRELKNTLPLEPAIRIRVRSWATINRDVLRSVDTFLQTRLGVQR